VALERKEFFYNSARLSESNDWALPTKREAHSTLVNHDTCQGYGENNREIQWKFFVEQAAASKLVIG
jgi:hypothetical protein